jgi:hypothetical protein
MQKDNQVSEQVQSENIETLALSFIKDTTLLALCKKAVKITKAYCLVTAHIEENQDITNRIRKDALDLSDGVLALTYRNTTNVLDQKSAIYARSMSLISMTEILRVLGLVSENNAAILVGQLKIFLNEVVHFYTVSDKVNTTEPSLSFFEFDTKDIDNQSEVKSVNTRITPVPEFVQKTRVVQSSFHPSSTEFREKIGTAKSIEQIHGLDSQVSSENPAQNHMIEKKDNVLYKTGTSKIKSNTEESKTDRQDLIINTIVHKGELSIKDLAAVIKGCSEKTIQRELLSLVERGILSKIGERRWSRYSIAR